MKLYRFLVSIRLTPNKSKTIGALKIPDKYFADFLRGHLDGDGCTYPYYDPRWKNSFMLYTEFISASKDHLIWIEETIKKLYIVSGKITYHKIYHLRYAKKSSLIILKKMYYKKSVICLQRKYSKIKLALGIISK